MEVGSHWGEPGDETWGDQSQESLGGAVSCSVHSSFRDWRDGGLQAAVLQKQPPVEKKQKDLFLLC